MKSFLQVLSLCLVSLGLTACMFGMTESQFKSLPPDQQKQVIDGYNQQQAIAKQNEPLNRLVDVADTAVNDKNDKF